MEGATAECWNKVPASHRRIEVNGRLLAAAGGQRRRGPVRQPGSEGDGGVANRRSRLQSLFEVGELSTHLGLRLAVDRRTQQPAGGVTMAQLSRPRAVRSPVNGPLTV